VKSGASELAKVRDFVVLGAAGLAEAFTSLVESVLVGSSELGGIRQTIEDRASLGLASRRAFISYVWLVVVVFLGGSR